MSNRNKLDDVVARYYVLARSALIDGPITIAQKGIYKLSTSFRNTAWNARYEHVIEITTSNVEINLDGNEISVSAEYCARVPTLALIRLGPGVSNVLIKNGKLGYCPTAIAGMNNRALRFIDLLISGFTRAALDIVAPHASEFRRLTVTSGKSKYGREHEHALRLQEYLHSFHFAEPIPPKILAGLDALLESEAAKLPLNSGTEAEDLPTGSDGDDTLARCTSNEAVIGINIEGNGSRMTQGVLMEKLVVTVIGQPQEVIGIGHEGKLLRDVLGYLIRWDDVFEAPAIQQDEETLQTSIVGGFQLQGALENNPILASQLWLGLQTQSLSTEFVAAVQAHRRNEGPSTNAGAADHGFIGGTVPVGRSGDFRGNPIDEVVAFRLSTCNNCKVVGCDFTAINLNDQVERKELGAEEGPKRDAMGCQFVQANATTVEGCRVSQVRSLYGRAKAAEIADGSMGLTLANFRIGSIVSMPADSEMQPLVGASPARAWGVHVRGKDCREIRLMDVQRESKDCIQSIAEPSFVSFDAEANFSGTLGQTLLGS